VALGEPLSLQQTDVQRNGWAISAGSMPKTRSRISCPRRVVWFDRQGQHVCLDTQHLQGVQVDTGVQDGGEIPMFYDSMIAKLIVARYRPATTVYAKTRGAQ
jgi:propionyl-CoA carboxylase alpha chain